MLQGLPQAPGAARAPMRVWVWSKLLWNPSLDTQALMQDFIYDYYGEAAEPIWQYNQMLWQAFEENPGDFRSSTGVRFYPDVAYLTKDFVHEADALFDEALSLTENKELRQRIEVARLPITYVKLTRGPEFTGEGYGDLIGPFAEVVRRNKIIYAMECPQSDMESKTRMWGIAATRPPAKFPGTFAAEEAETRCNVNCGHQLIEDERASAQYANRIPNEYAYTDFAASWSVPPEIVNSGRKYALRVRVRLDKTGNRGWGFRAGVWDFNKGYTEDTFGEIHTQTKDPGSVIWKAWKAGDVSGQTYGWFEVGRFEPTLPVVGDRRLWVYVAGVSNPTGDVQGVFLDRLELIPVEVYDRRYHAP